MYQLLSKSVAALSRLSACMSAGLIIIAAGSAVPHLPFSSTAHAQCVQTGLSVICDGTDTDGFSVGTGLDALNVLSGATVSDTAGPAAIDVTGLVSTLRNDGTITGLINPVGGVRVGAIGTGGFINTGNISSSDVTPAVFVNGDVVGAFNNSGSIRGFVGLDVQNDLTSLSNTGTIFGLDDDAILVGNTIGSLNNSGVIDANDDGVDAFTITSLTNTGLIDAGEDGVSAAQIVLLTNFGEIIGGNGFGGDDEGVEAALISRLINYGEIFGGNNGVQAQNLTELVNFGLIDSFGDGIDVDGGVPNDETSVISNLINHGTIRGDDDGIDVGTLTRLVNTGNIIGGYLGADESGIAAAVITEIINSGVIKTNGDITTAFAIEERGRPEIGVFPFVIPAIDGGPTVLTLNAGSILIGRVDLGGGTNTLNIGRGRSLNSTFEDPDGASEVPVLGSLAGHLFAFQDTANLGGGTDRQIVAVDLSAFVGFEDALSALTAGYGRVVQTRQAGLRTGQGNGFSAGDLDGTISVTDGHVWVEGFGAFRHDESDRIGGDFDHLTGGLVAGMDRPLDDVTSIGAMVGFAASTSENDINTQTNNATSFYAGLYGSTESMGVAWDASLTVGYTDYAAERITANNLVAGGLETARADFGGWFINPQVTATRQASNPWAGQGVHGFVAVPTLEQSLTLSYAGLFLDGYTETGTTNPLTLDDRSVHVASARAAIALPFERTETDGALTTLRLIGGLEARTRFGDDTVSGTLLGQAVRSTLDDDDFDAGVFLGLSGEYQTPSGLTAYAQAEAMLDTDFSYQVSASAGLRIAF